MESRAEISKAGDAVKKKHGESDLKKCSSPCNYSWWIMGDTTEGRVGEGWDSTWEYRFDLIEFTHKVPQKS